VFEKWRSRPRFAFLLRSPGRGAPSVARPLDRAAGCGKTFFSAAC